VSYDFFVFPAARAQDLNEALHVYETSPETGPVADSGPVARFVAALDPGLVTGEPRGSDAGVCVATSWDDPMANLARVAGYARPQDLSVLDVQLGALYDPRGALDVALQTEAGPQLPYLTRTVLRAVLAHIEDGRYRWLTLSRTEGTYVQSFRDQDGSWVVEHREGDPGRHFAARSSDATLVEDLLWAWARGDGRWRAMRAFSPVEI
jgi:hypothetical protein